MGGLFDAGLLAATIMPLCPTAFAPSMSPTAFPLRRLLPLLLATLLAGPISCDPAVSRFEMDTVQTRVDEQANRLKQLDKELDAAKKDFKELQSFGGQEHQTKLRNAEKLRAEKEELEGLKKGLDDRLQYFEKEAARHRETLAKMQQQQPPPPKP